MRERMQRECNARKRRAQVDKQHPEGENKKPGKEFLTTPLCDLVFRSSFTTPKPSGSQEGIMCKQSMSAHRINRQIKTHNWAFIQRKVSMK